MNQFQQLNCTIHADIPVTEITCYRCNALIARQMEYGGNGPLPPVEDPCQYQLCRGCTRALCEVTVANEKQVELDVAYLEGKTDSRSLAPCRCRLCQKEDGQEAAS